MTSKLSALRSKLQEISNSETDHAKPQQEELTGSSTTLLAQIQEQGNRPEDWLEYTNLVRDKTSFPSPAERNTALCAVYKKALKAIPYEVGKTNAAYAQLLVDQACHMAEQNPEEAADLFGRARHQATRFAVVHVAAAQFQLDRGNSSKASALLEKAKEKEAQPNEMIRHAFRNLVDGRAVLLTAQEKAQYSIEKPTEPIVQNKENVVNLLKPQRSWIDDSRSINAKAASTVAQSDRQSTDTGDSSPLKPHLSWLEKHKATGKTPAHTLAGNRSISANSLLSSTRSSHPPRMYTDKIRNTPGDSDDSSTHYTKPSSGGSGGGSSGGKKQRTEDDTVSFGHGACGTSSGESGGEDTVPCGGQIEKGVFRRTHDRPLPMRSYHSTPDFKNPSSLLSRTGAPSTNSSVRKTYRPNIPTGKAMRVKRSTVEPEEGMQTECDGPSASTIELLHTKSRDQTPVFPAASVSTIQEEREGELRKMSTGSDSGIMTSPAMAPIPTGSSSCSSNNSTLRATPSTQVSINTERNSSAASPPLETPQSQPAPVITMPPPPPPPQQQPPPLPQPVRIAPMSQPAPAPVQQYAPQPVMQQMPPANVLTVNGTVYTTIRVIGKGGSCKVWECLSPDCSMSVAIKCVSFENVDSTTINSYRNEISLLQRLQHSHRVIKLHDFEHNQDTNMLYLVMEKGDTDLATFFRQRSRTGDISPQLLRFYWSEMLNAVQVLHKEGIVHSDLKPANFLLVAGNLKLIDFGIANAIQQDMTSVTIDQQVGTLNYMSPEAIRDMCPSENHSKPTIKIGVKSDVWSLGCILYYLVYGKTPFQHITNQIGKIQAIMDESIVIKFPPINSADLLDTLQMCLIRDPKKRYSIEQLLAHRYCRSC